MKHKIKEKERLARRDVERFRCMLRSQTPGIAELKMLQDAHDRLLDAEIFRLDSLRDKLRADILKNPESCEQLLKVLASVPRYLCHGTSQEAAARILKEGITPRGGRAPNHPQTPSHPDCVYLTDAWALWYATLKGADPGCDRGAVFEVDLKPLLDGLLPDEDALGPWCDPRGVIENMAEGAGFFLNVICRSLYLNGTVAHRGPIPPSAIRRVAYIPHSSLLWLAATMWDDAAGRSAIQRQQQAILGWVFDGGDDPFPVPPEELVLNSEMAEAYIGGLAGGKGLLQTYIGAGVRLETLWRTMLMARPESLNRKGIEVVPVRRDGGDADDLGAEGEPYSGSLLIAIAKKAAEAQGSSGVIVI